MSQPKSFLIQTLVMSENSDGSFNTIQRSYFDGTVITGPLCVNVGDQVAWLVQVNIPGARKAFPYSIDFNTDSFFGVSSLNVPKGGLSPYLVVLPLKDKVSYKMTVAGLGCIFDPEIQSGSDSVVVTVLSANSVKVSWDTVSNTMSYYSTSMPTPSPFPPGGIKLKVGDKVEFDAIVASGNVAGFAIKFADNSNGWLTPFEPDHQSIVADSPTSTTIGPKRVNDPDDAGASFPFTACITVNGTTITFPPDPNVKFTM